MMRAAHLLLLSLCLCLPLAAQPPEAVGHIQVRAEPDIRISLDGQVVGQTLEAQGGLLLPAIPVGQHTILAEQEGKRPQEVRLELRADQVAVVQIELQQPAMRPAETDGPSFRGNPKGRPGRLVIQSLPVECTIAIPDLEIADVEKTKDLWRLGDIPGGTYEVTCTDARNFTLTYDVEIQANEEAWLLFNFADSEVVDVARERRDAEWYKRHADRSFTLPGANLQMIWVPQLEGWVSQVEISNYLYQQFRPEHRSGTYREHELGTAHQPAVNLTFAEAAAYAQWLTEQHHRAGLPQDLQFRLPAVSEWQAIAAGSAAEPRTYPWGNDWPPAKVNLADMNSLAPVRLSGYHDDFPVTAAVTNAGANHPLGLVGLAGNAAEWAAGPRAAGAYAYALGGSWFHRRPEVFRCDAPGLRFALADRLPYVGFRVLLSSQPMPTE